MSDEYDSTGGYRVLDDRASRFPALNHAARIERGRQHRQAILDWLASGELYTTADIMAVALALSPSRARSILREMVGNKLLVEDRFDERLSLPKLYGITAHGIALSATPDVLKRSYGRDRLAQSRIVHDLLVQEVRAAVDRFPRSQWIPARALMARPNNERPRKIPDALFILPGGERAIAWELERTIKPPETYRKLMSAFHEDFERGHYAHVNYVSPDDVEARIKKAFLSAQSFCVNDLRGSTIHLTESEEGRAFMQRFTFLGLSWVTGRKPTPRPGVR